MDIRTDFIALESFLLLLRENVENPRSLAELSLEGLDVSQDVGRTQVGQVQLGQYLVQSVRLKLIKT